MEKVHNKTVVTGEKTNKNFVVKGVEISGTVSKSDLDQFNSQGEALVKVSGGIHMLVDITGKYGE